MAYAPIAHTIPQYDKITLANWWLKAYEQGTTTPVSMATDADGGTLLAKAELDSEGFPITAGSARFIPFIDGYYDLWCFPTSAEADANDTTNAIQFADNLSASFVQADTIEDIAALRAAEGSSNQRVVVLSYYAPNFTLADPYDGGGGDFAWDATSVEADTGGTVIKVTSVTTGRWIRIYSGEISVKAFGATGDGVTDDAPALDAAVSGLFDLGGGTLFAPAGTYLLSTLSTDSDGLTAYITSKDNVSIKGEGMGLTIFKIADGENAKYPSLNQPNVIATNKSTPLTNCKFEDFTIDWNGANNLLTAGMTTRNNAGLFALNGGIDILIERVEIKETPGNQCIFFPASSDLGQGNIKVRNCQFLNNGSGLTSNYNLDHSSVYCNGNDNEYINNSFYADNAVNGTAYEIHGSNSYSARNKSYNYNRGFYIASDFEAITNITVENDKHDSISTALSLSAPTYGINKVRIVESDFIQRSGLTPLSTTNFVNGNTITACDSMEITGCKFVGYGYSMRFMQQYKIENLTLERNEISGFALYGLISAALDLGGGEVINTLKVVNNTFKDVLRTIYFNTALTSEAIIIQGNNFYLSSSDANPAIFLSFTSSGGNVSDNVINSNYTTKYGGTSNGVDFENVVKSDYSPTVYGTTVAGVGTYTTEEGRYVVQNDICTYTFNMEWSAHTGTGTLRIQLPFTAKTGPNWAGACFVGDYTHTANSQTNVYAVAGTDYAQIAITASGASVTNAPMDSVASVSGTIIFEKA